MIDKLRLYREIINKMVSQETMRFTEWRDYFFNEYIMESCNNNIMERRDDELDNYDYTVKIKEGEFFSFSKEQGDPVKCSSRHSPSSQHNENFEIKYLTPFQSDENAAHNEESGQPINNPIKQLDTDEKVELLPQSGPSPKEVPVSTDDTSKEKLPEAKLEDRPEKEEYRFRKKTDADNSPSGPHASYSSNKKNLKLEINVNNDVNTKKVITEPHEDNIQLDNEPLFSEPKFSENSLHQTKNDDLNPIVNQDLGATLRKPRLKEHSRDKKEENVERKEEVKEEKKDEKRLDNVVEKIEEVKNPKKEDIKQFNEEDLDKNADLRIKELQEKLQTLKYQNEIVMDENAKLLEILHLYKIIQSIESKEKTKVPQVLKYPLNKYDGGLMENRAANNLNKNNFDGLYQIDQINSVQEPGNPGKVKITKNKENIPSDKNQNNITLSNKPKFKQFINKSNLSQSNRKTYRQLHSHNETNPNSKNSSYSNRPNDIPNNTFTSSEVKGFNLNQQRKAQNENEEQQQTKINSELMKDSNSVFNNYIPNSGKNSLPKSNPFMEDLKRLELKQKNQETSENKPANLQYNSPKIIEKEDEAQSKYNNIYDPPIKNLTEDIKNDEDFNKNYESIMSYFSKYREANAKVIENLVLLEENNENILSNNKSKRKKNLKSLEEFYKNNVDKPIAPSQTMKDNSRYNLASSKSFSEKIVFSENNQLQTNAIKLIPFHLVEKKKLLINMMNYLYGKNIFQFKKNTSTV